MIKNHSFLVPVEQALVLKLFTSDWDLNLRGWDSDPVKTWLGTGTHMAGT